MWRVGCTSVRLYGRQLRKMRCQNSTLTALSPLVCCAQVTLSYQRNKLHRGDMALLNCESFALDSQHDWNSEAFPASDSMANSELYMWSIHMLGSSQVMIGVCVRKAARETGVPV